MMCQQFVFVVPSMPTKINPISADVNGQLMVLAPINSRCCFFQVDSVHFWKFHTYFQSKDEKVRFQKLEKCEVKSFFFTNFHDFEFDKLSACLSCCAWVCGCWEDDEDEEFVKNNYA